MQRCRAGRHLAIAHVRVPPVAAFRFERVDLAFLVLVRHHDQLLEFGMVVFLRDVRLEPPEVSRELHHLRGAQRLIAKHQHDVVEERPVHVLPRFLRKRLGDVDADDLRQQRIAELAHFDSHDLSLHPFRR